MVRATSTKRVDRIRRPARGHALPRLRLGLRPGRRIAILTAAGLLLALAGVPVASQPQKKPIRKTLENGVRWTGLEVMEAKGVEVQVWIDCRGFPSAYDARGLRHFAEHLMAQRAGTQGPAAFLLASTGPDWMQFRIFSPVEELEASLRALRQVLEPSQFSPEQVEQEKGIIREELKLTDFERPGAFAAWEAAMGAVRPHPMGYGVAGADASAEELTQISAWLSDPARIVVATVGAASEGRMESAVQTFRTLTRSQGELRPESRDPANPASDWIRIKLDGWSSPKAAQALALGFAIQSADLSLGISVTPTLGASAVLVQRPGEKAKERLLDRPAHYLELGRDQALQWLQVRTAKLHGTAETLAFLALGSTPLALTGPDLNSLDFAQAEEALREVLR